MKNLREIGEDALISRLVRLMPLADEREAGPGDDCAVVDLALPNQRLQLLKTDALVGGIHFLPETPAKAVGWKAIARVVSDMAAMGGRAERFLVTLAFPAETEIAWVEDLYIGMGDCMRAFGAVLAGGETSSVQAGAAPVISIAATGSVNRDFLVLRSTGKPGHVLLVTGTLGGSIRGKHLDFIPRVREVEWLVANWKPSAMMDLSDGLAKDLPRLADASGCGFVINESAIPVADGCDLGQALGDGEDYELLIALESERVAGLLDEWHERFPGLELTVIGSLVEPGAGDSLTGGWDHFSANGA
ncbi:MAG: thiamine-monophosphate kinase [Gloeobacteraceae cyanobacterium ES-bin-144]|nr:thiamine-monophosphate kinase [Verrucomicrobiales bacterium]